MFLRVTGPNYSTNAQECWESLPVNYTTSEDVDDGWVRVSIAFNTVSAGAHTVGVYCEGGSGVFYADDLQVERGGAYSAYNLLQNGSMEMSSYGWTRNADAAISTEAVFTSASLHEKQFGVKSSLG